MSNRESTKLVVAQSLIKRKHFICNGTVPVHVDGHSASCHIVALKQDVAKRHMVTIVQDGAK